MSDNKNVNNKEKGFVVGGYTFKTKQEAQEAKDEMNAIKYLSGKTDSTSARATLRRCAPASPICSRGWAPTISRSA